MTRTYRQDEITGSLTIIDDPHHEVHEGEMYDVCELISLGLGATRNYLITTGIKSVHFKYDVTADGKGNVTLYEDTTTSSAGTSMSELNRNRISTNTAITVVTHTPTITGDGTMLCQELFGSSNKSGGEARSENEWILKKNSKYMIRITATVALDFSIKINWYEEE